MVLVIYLKKVEVESLVKSFFLFFILQSLLVGALFLLEYKKEIKNLDETIFSSMRICSYNLTCDQFKIDFVAKDDFELYKLYKGEAGLSSYFSIPNSSKNSLKIYLSNQEYNIKINILKETLIVRFLIVVIIIFILSFLFSIYTLSPLRNALLLTEEFIKDILHDFNTPLAILRLNTSMLKDEHGSTAKINRIENAVQNILNLQSNLRSYLDNSATQKEIMDLSSFIKNRVLMIDKNYRGIEFHVDIENIYINTNKDAFTRIVDNLVSNAAKYNKSQGKVTISYKKHFLYIEDTGKGIQNPKKVFERFYKEQDRGIGIGLHIVKKLCDEMNITISIESKVKVGTTVILDLKNILK